jgi:parallel beta-helix repeat protein
MRRTANIALILILIMALGMICVQPVRAQYRGDITVNANGSVSPPSAPVQQTGNTYTLTGDIDGSITVNRNNIVLDGNRHTLYGQGYTPFGDLSLNGTSNVTVKDFIIPCSLDTYPQVIGIQLTNATHVSISNNTITGFESVEAWNGGSYTAIDVEGGSSNLIEGNSLRYNIYGISLSDTTDNQVIGNNVVGDVNFKFLYTTGIYVADASNNLIYHNNFINSTTQAIVSDSVETWDDGYPIGGNYWSNYWMKNPNAAEIGNSTILNTPYTINSQNIDRYPLLNPFNSTIYAIEASSPKISIISPLSKVYNQSILPLVFTLNEKINWIGYSLDEMQNVTITGNCTIANLTNGLHYIIVYANNTYGNIGSQTVNFTVSKPEPFPTLVVIAVILVAVAISVSLLIYRRHRKTSNEKATLTV